MINNNKSCIEIIADMYECRFRHGINSNKGNYPTIVFYHYWRNAFQSVTEIVVENSLYNLLLILGVMAESIVAMAVYVTVIEKKYRKKS